MITENKILSEEITILRKFNLGEGENQLQEFEEIRKKFIKLRKEKEDLEFKLKRIQQEEKMISTGVDLNDKLALKKLVVMLKIKNDRLKKKLENGGYSKPVNKG